MTNIVGFLGFLIDCATVTQCHKNSLGLDQPAKLRD